MTEKEKLIALYAQNSKHSNYQILSDKLSSIINAEDISVRTRYEKERLCFILNNVSVKGKSIVDIGGNSGYFSFELIEAGAKKVTYYEGNKAHADFVKLASKVLEVGDKIEIHNRYFTFANELNDDKVDIILLLNVLHHIGDDYGNSTISMQKAKEEIFKQLNSLYDKTDMLIFQLGFNWKGNSNTCLFEHGTKMELIDFIENGIQSFWDIQCIGIAEKNHSIIEYKLLSEENSQRQDSLGEFLNRPLFILKSKK